jgi:CSLREA domain-containing protein
VDDGVPGIAHCSLREAINAANSTQGTNTINFATAIPGLMTGVTGTITLTNGELTINNNVNISGPGATNLTLSGNNASRVFTTHCTPVSMSGLTIADGNAVGGNGGGIQGLGGSLLLNDCVVSNCVANVGGGIYCDEARICGFQLDLTRCTITRNTASVGGGVFASGRFSASESTICSNTGGGVYTIFVGGLTNCTISGNAGDGLYRGPAAAQGYEFNLASCTICSNSGVGIRNDNWASWSTVVTARNTIVSGNSGGSGPDCSGGLNSGDFNLIQDTNGCVISGANTHNLYNQDPKLGPLADLGGPTPTHALRFDSPAH